MRKIWNKKNNYRDDMHGKHEQSMLAAKRLADVAQEVNLRNPTRSGPSRGEEGSRYPNQGTLNPSLLDTV